jgi:hypothetical protein
MAEGPSFWKATTPLWLAVLALTIATALIFNRMVPDAPLSSIDLAFVAFFWFLISFGARWLWMHHGKKKPSS